MMERAATVAAMRAWRAGSARRGERVALVPTMGALHEGHLALVDLARAHADRVVMSIFVNPLQFRPGEDFERYPRDLERDASLAATRGVDLLFCPAVDDMYPPGRETLVVAGETASRWEGAARPGHFDGVLTVVAKLFHLVQPDEAIFGQKDIQQVTLIRGMVRDLDFPLALRIAPIVREADGLALSSRNIYLDAAQRQAATALHRGLRAAQARWQSGERSAAALEAAVRQVLEGLEGVVTEYIAVTDPDRLAPVAEVPPGSVVAVAARLGRTRLIDNVILREGGA